MSKRVHEHQGTDKALEERKAQMLRILVAARKLFGEGGWCDKATVSRAAYGTQNVVYYLGCLERDGKIEHRKLRGQDQWRAPAAAA